MDATINHRDYLEKYLEELAAEKAEHEKKAAQCSNEPGRELRRKILLMLAEETQKEMDHVRQTQRNFQEAHEDAE